MNTKQAKQRFGIVGNNHFAKKTLEWKIKKNIFLAAQEIFKKYKSLNRY